ncbi:MAG: ATP-binding cassette domain-containing protein [Oscillospiraceae bacterium]|nr:ATP-binding cassette domain-containing protein [Oscillospiraceae bacterium]
MTENTAVMATYGLQKAYGSCQALDGVNMLVRRGDIYGLVGRNGAGKTTIMRMISGQSQPTGGEMELFGASGKNMRSQRERTGAMIEIPSFSPFLSARENLEYYRLQRGIPGKGAVDEMLELVDLADTGKKKFKAFSLGMKQRLGLALALMNHPDFLILDEPINGLDPEGVAEFRQILRRLNQERQTTILISSHILSELSSIATRYGFMEQGKIIEEISAEALHDKCRTCLRLEVDDAAKAAAVLQTQLGTDKFEVLPGNVVQLYDCLDDPKRASYALAQNGVALLAMEQKGADLEAYFLNLIGGGRNA